MTVKDSIEILTGENKYIDRLQIFKTANPLLVIYTKSRNKSYSEFYEYLSDSIYLV